MKTRYGLSPWIDSFPTRRRPSFEPFRGDKTADVVIVGGGLTGCATAQALAAAGRKPLLLEAARIGQGAGGRSTGLLLSEPGVRSGIWFSVMVCGRPASCSTRGERLPSMRRRSCGARASAATPAGGEPGCGVV